MGFREEIKPNYTTGKRPPQAHFWEWLDKSWLKDELLPITAIDGLQAILNALAAPVDSYVTSTAQHNYTIPAGYVLEYVVIIPQSNSNCRIDLASAPGAGDLLIEIPVTTDGHVAVCYKLAVSATNIVVDGLPLNSTLKFVKRKIS